MYLCLDYKKTFFLLFHRDRSETKREEQNSRAKPGGEKRIWTLFCFSLDELRKRGTAGSVIFVRLQSFRIDLKLRKFIYVHNSGQYCTEGIIFLIGICFMAVRLVK